MNKVITDGLVLMPPPFSQGLQVWARGDGTPGSASYADDPAAAFVPSDADFGGALELVKTQSVQKLRYTGETPILPGCYLRITAKVKAISGNLPAVRIAAWAGRGTQMHVGGLVETGGTVPLTRYGEVVEVSAIVGTGTRVGVDMPWGLEPIFGHFGIDLTGPNGGVIRIDDLVIEDVSSIFLSDIVAAVDVRDFGARGDGSTDDSAAFIAADAAAEGREVLVPEGVFHLGDHVTMASPVRFVGTVTAAAQTRLVLRRDFNLPSYLAAFGDEQLAFRKAFQALLNNTDHESLDLGGLRVELDEPIDMAAAVGNQDRFEIRRVIRNGQFNAIPGAGWTVAPVTSQASYSSANPRSLANVANIANIEVGSHVEGRGVGREVYVTARNVGAGTLTLSQPLHGPAPSQSYSFTRYRYALDFSGFSKLSKFTLTDIELQLDGRASGILLAPSGETFHIRDCFVTKPRDRGVTSHGTGCQDLQIDRCHFISAEQSAAATDRSSIGFNVNANDAKIRDSRFQRLGTTMVLAGNGHLIVGNHWFQGDNVSDGPRTAGLVLTETNVKSVVTGNYLDNSFLEWTNEHDAAPDFSNEFSFGGLSLTGNIFTANDVAAHFSWIVIKPFGSGHFLHGLSVTGNCFKAINGAIERVEKVDDSIAELDFSKSRLVTFSANTFNGVSQETVNPVSLEFEQPDNAVNWTLDPGPWLPFGGWSRTVAGLVPEGVIRTSSNAAVHAFPSILPLDGPARSRVRLEWPVAVRGKVQLSVRMDRPY
ncbi:glycosyl hydrolase family 28-related protein [Profundibacterium mesophilum]|uniref:Endopygalactorunase Cell envelope biogenesis n=1 Tax=Profundibacterium mesophilum KAUST100406-0324 TaxID=1037889 RepID=A0A921NV06_9RHOB|nr:glycosyl hydrolase family 28-related protein [Profundibacterium mesophilum]KAF0675294.1 Endopygalactorunase Cell envelope biogenesis [Profundibacterium mesophilum KAUST100406-0324]